MKYIIGGIIVLALIFFIFFHKKQAPAPEAAPSQETQSSVTESETPTTAAPEQKDEKQQQVIHKEVKNGMTIEVLKEGNGLEIKNGQTAVMQYTGMFTDGKVFDATSKRGNQPFSFVLGSGMVIKGWDEGVLGMKVGETRKLTIPPELAYGKEGYPGAIPGNATLIFEVTLEAIK